MSEETLEERFLRFLRENKQLSTNEANSVLSEIKAPLQNGDSFDDFYNTSKTQLPLNNDALTYAIELTLGKGPTVGHLVDFLKHSANNGSEDERPTDSGLESKVKPPATVSLAGESQASIDNDEPIPVEVETYDPSESMPLENDEDLDNLINGLFVDRDDNNPESDEDWLEEDSDSFDEIYEREPSPNLEEEITYEREPSPSLDLSNNEEEGSFFGNLSQRPTRDFSKEDNEEPIEHRKSARWPYGVALLGAAALALIAGRNTLGDLGSQTFDYLSKPFSGLFSPSDKPDQGIVALLDTADEPEPEMDITDGVNYPTLNKIVEEVIEDEELIIKTQSSLVREEPIVVTPSLENKEDNSYFSFDGNVLTFTPKKGSSIFEFAAMLDQYAQADRLGSTMDVYTLTSMSETEQDQLRLSLRKEKWSGDSLDTNLELTRLIIEQNSGLVHNIDLSLEGLKDGTKNVIYTDTTLSLALVPDSYADDNNTMLIQQRLVDDIESVAYSATDNVSLEQSLTAFRDLESLVQENPSLIESRNLDINETRTNLAQEVARQYNSNDGLDNIDLNQWAYDKRISLAIEWYKNCANPGDRETYMTVSEIVEKVNLNLADGDKAIAARDIRKSTDFRRSGLGTLAVLNTQRSSAREERKAKVYSSFVEQGISDLGSTEAKQFVREQAEELGFTERTVKQYIKESVQEVPEPQSLTYDDVVLGGTNRTFLYTGKSPEEKTGEVLIEPVEELVEVLEEIVSLEEVPESQPLTYDNVVLGGGNKTFLYCGDPSEEMVEETVQESSDTVERIILSSLADTYDPLISATPLDEFIYPSLSQSITDYKSIFMTCMNDSCNDVEDFVVSLTGGYDGIRQLIVNNIVEEVIKEEKLSPADLKSLYSDDFNWTYDMRLSLAVDLVNHANGYNNDPLSSEVIRPSSHLKLPEIIDLVNDLRDNKLEKSVSKKDLYEQLESENTSNEELDLSYLTTSR